jgi:hypothetical protein
MSDRGNIMPEIIEEGRPPSNECARCDDCGRVWPVEGLKEPARLSERLDPGGIVPSGECPECGALAYPLDLETGGTATEKLQHAAKLKRDYEDHMRCGRTDAAKETLEERDLLLEGMSRLERVMLRTDALEHNEVMQQVITIILDREEDDVLSIDAIIAYLDDDEKGADFLYMEAIAPAIDRCEDLIRHATIVRHLKEGS